MQFDASSFAPPPYYSYGYASPPPSAGAMPPRAHTFHDGYPTPVPSPRSPSSSRRRSATADFMKSAEYKRPSSSRRNEVPFNPATSPRGHGPFVHTPMHTPPPMSHGAMPNIYAYTGFSTTPQPEYYGHHAYSTNPAPGHHSPPPNMRDTRYSRSHHRREATWSGDQDPRASQRSSKTSTPVSKHKHPEAPKPRYTEEELRARARMHKIPDDYSLKNWDPKDRPIILLGSVFDPSSLGEWIYNWTKFCHGKDHQASKSAAGLWELMTELDFKMTRTVMNLDKIQHAENRDILRDFLEAGERLWRQLRELIKACEEYMWVGASRVRNETSEGKTKVEMGQKSGAEFVKAMFHGDREWRLTDGFMRSAALWVHRFTVNAEIILRNADS